MKQRITIRDRTIGDDEPLFLIAECGVTCNYDIKVTKELIDVVRDAGADAIKFIFWFPDEIMSDRSIPYSYKTVDGQKTENMYEMLQKLKFTFEQWEEVKRYADAKDVVMFSTVNSPTGIAWAEKLGLEAYKLSSWDFNHIPLWREIAAKRKPMVIDTGPVWPSDVTRVLDVMREQGNDQAVLIHNYHTDEAKEMNMRTIPYMRRAFRCPVGFSSKDTADEMDYVGVALGASVVEKRLTLSRRLPGHHHVLSKEPAEFKAWVKAMRQTQDALGVEDLIPSKGDLSERKKWFRRIVADRPLKAGTRLTAEDLEGKRPADGVSAEHLDVFVGRTLKRDVKENEPLSWDDV